MKKAAFEDDLLSARIEDAFKATGCRHVEKFIGFLNLHERKIAENICKTRSSDFNYEFWGGYDGAERVMLGISPLYKSFDTSDYPILSVQFDWKNHALTHRDFLGALLSLGIKREKIGDLLISCNRCITFLHTSIEPYVKQNLQKVGSVGVQCSVVQGSIDYAPEFKILEGTMASDRLDCLIAALLNVSRGESEKLIAGGLVASDFVPAYHPDGRIREGSTVSIRGHGRFIIDQLGPVTKKGRLKYSARKYI